MLAVGTVSFADSFADEVADRGADGCVEETEQHKYIAEQRLNPQGSGAQACSHERERVI